MRSIQLAAALALPGLQAASAQTLERFHFERPAMGTVFALTFYTPDSATARVAAAAAFARIDTLEQHLSDYNPESEISRLSDTAGSGDWVPVSSDLWIVLNRAHFWSARTDGAFDVTVGPLSRLWRWSHRRDLPVDTVRLATALTAVGYTGLRLDSASHRVSLQWPGMRLDVGGIGKGYAADEALAVLRHHGVTCALVDAGGDLVLGDAPPGALGWRIDLPAVTPAGEALRDVRLMANVGVATSGDEYQVIELDGERRSHVIDPRTGRSVGLRRIVTVISRTGIDADALASAVLVLGNDKGMALIAELDKTCVRVVDRGPWTAAPWRLTEGCGGQ